MKTSHFEEAQIRRIGSKEIPLSLEHYDVASDQSGHNRHHLVLASQGLVQRWIASELDINRETVARYLQRSEAASKPANAPAGSDTLQTALKPANAPPGADTLQAASKPANAPSGSDALETWPTPTDQALASAPVSVTKAPVARASASPGET